MATTKVETRFVIERTTTGAIRYMEISPENLPRTTDAQGAVIGTLYFRKKGIGAAGVKGEPKVCKVTIEFEN